MRTPFSRTGRRGIASVEFGLWITIIVVMLSGLLDLSWYMARSEVVMRAARDGARTGAATIETSNDAPGSLMIPAANSAATALVNDLGVGGCAVSSTMASDGNNLRAVTTNVSCPYTALMGIWPGYPTSIQYSFTMFADFQLN